MPIRIPKDMPCTPDCPDRKPGCFCEKKKEWNLKHEERKKVIREAKSRNDAIIGVRSPDTGKKRRSR